MSETPLGFMSTEALTPPGPTLEAADAYCRYLTGHHYENFAVASRFVDARKRLDLARIYAFCRSTDDLGDESPGASALPRLERWRDETAALFAGMSPIHPVLVALAETVRAHRMPAQPFLDLIEANVRDQRVKSYATWPELDEYCRLSAAPVGRMVLRVFEIDDPAAEAWSDDVCIGLQLANHAQDVRRDAEIGRRYLIEEDVVRDGTAGAVRAMVHRARALLSSGCRLEAIVPLPLRLQLALYRLGGFAICASIERLEFRTQDVRPTVGAGKKASIAVRALLETFAAPGRLAPT